MLAASPEGRFFGVDLRALSADVFGAWARAQRWPLFSWLTPAMRVSLYHPDGTVSICLDDGTVAGGVAQVGKKKRPRFVALELPPELALVRTVRLPGGMGRDDVAAALALQAKTFSPFPPEDLLWACEPLPVEGQPGANSFALILVSRPQVDAYVEDWRRRQSGTPSLVSPEIWVSVREGKFAPLPGVSSDARLKHSRRLRNVAYLLVVSALAVSALLAATPTMKLRMQALQAAAAYEELVRRTAPTVREREQVALASGKLTALSDILGERVEPLRIIDTLTQILPDDAALQTLQVTGAKVSMSGQANDSAQLMQKLGEQPGIRDVKAPSPATRMSNSSKENFSIEFVLDPKVFGVPQAVASAPSPDTKATAAKPEAPPGTPAGGVPSAASATAASGATR